MATQDSNQRSERPKRRMVLRKIAQSPDDSRVSLASSQPTSPRPGVAPKAPSRTVRPPPPPDSDPDAAAAPIPLTRLHTPRPRFRSAIDLPAYVPPSSGSADEGLVHETSSTTLPPLVASLPPPAAPIYIPRHGARPSWIGRAAVWGSAALLAAVVVSAGIAVGRRVARSDDGPTLHVLAPAAPAAGPTIQGMPREGQGNASASPSAGDLAQPQAAVVPVVALPVVTGPAGVALGATPVEALPRAPAPSPLKVSMPSAMAPQPAVVRPAIRPAAPAAAAAAPAALTDTHPSTPTAAPPAVRVTDKDPASSDVAPASAAAPVAEPPTDPLVKAVRDDIEEEESRAQRGQHGK